MNGVQDLGILIFPALFAMLAIERMFPATKLATVHRWHLRGLAFFIVSSVLAPIGPALIAYNLHGRSIFHLSFLGMVPGAVVGLVVTDAATYWVHRTLHRNDFLWRWTHQMHHSAERMDMVGLTYSHPFDVIVTLSTTGTVTALLGLSPDAAGLCGLVGGVLGAVFHMNVRTPSWLGYVFCRPEQHALHHERGIHAFNYAVFPFWDMVFGTFRNPDSFPTKYGFWDGASARVGAMLIGRDVSEPRGTRCVDRSARKTAQVVSAACPMGARMNYRAEMDGVERRCGIDPASEHLLATRCPESLVMIIIGA